MRNYEQKVRNKLIHFCRLVVCWRCWICASHSIAHPCRKLQVLDLVRAHCKRPYINTTVECAKTKLCHFLGCCAKSIGDASQTDLDRDRQQKYDDHKYKLHYLHGSL